MSRPDATASAALDADYIRPGFFGFLDIVGDPIRVNTLGYDITITGSGFQEMDGYTFAGIDGRVVDIDPVRMRAGGSEQVTARLSGLRDLDNATLNTLGDRANWQGRPAMLWRMIRDATGTQQGAIQHYYTGYMVALGIKGDPFEQTIEVAIETYLAAFSAASNRTYLDQERYDPGDLSARAAIAIANGISGPSSNVALGGIGGSGRSVRDALNVALS